MKPLYIETSAILAWLFGEPDTAYVLDMINSRETIVSSTLSILETLRSLVRAEQSGTINSANHQKMKGLFLNQAYEWTFLEITSSVRERAGGQFPVEPVRSLDAIHLSSALEFLQVYPDLEVLSFDRRISDNLEPLGLTKAGG